MRACDLDHPLSVAGQGGTGLAYFISNSWNRADRNRPDLRFARPRLPLRCSNSTTQVTCRHQSKEYRNFPRLLELTRTQQAHAIPVSGRTKMQL